VCAQPHESEHKCRSLMPGIPHRLRRHRETA
jgi:hypothetical protein